MTEKVYKEVLSVLKGIVSETKFEGHLYAVGGCVRDSIMGFPIKDIDLVVDLPNGGIEFAEWLCNKHYLTHEPVVYPTYGTAMFQLLKFPDLELEVVETRKEQYKDKNSRNPEVQYGTLMEDCMRRDLTINAIYYDITNENLIDLVGGQEDIKNKIIKTPTDPNIIYQDDPLRMMRTCRFANRYGWNIEAETFRSIKNNSSRLSIISKERIVDEMKKGLLTAILPNRLFQEWDMTGLFKYIAPEFANMKMVEKVFYNARTYKFISHLSTYIGKDATFEMYLAAIYRPNPKAMKSLKLPNATIETTTKYIDSLNYVNGDTNLPALRKFGIKYGSLYKDCVKLIHSYILSWYTDDVHLEWLQIFENNIKTLEQYKTMFDDTTVLPVDGFDIMKWFELKPSAKVKELMNKAWEFYYVNPRLTKKDLEKMLRDCIM